MIEVKRGHLAGLELALSNADIGNTETISVGELKCLIAQASSAPAQEPVAWINRESLAGVPKSFSRHWLNKECTTEDDTALYTHADPAEVGELLAMRRLAEDSSNELIARCIGHKKQLDAATQRADAAERKLSDAMELLRDADNWVRVLRTQFGYNQTKDLESRIDQLLSASAEPAKCSPCACSRNDPHAANLIFIKAAGDAMHGINQQDIEDDNHEWQSRHDAERADYFDDPAKGGDGEAV